MLTKEYRIPLPLSVEEYRIAQLYMIQKKSREESQGEGSGVEILVNEPYTDGPGGNGQYTYKIYHIGSHLPGWFRTILPKSALRVEEEAWNAYPYTKTRYKCPFIEKFVIEIETCYLSDGGEVENVFNLSSAELRSRTVDIIDIVNDQISSSDYKKDEDPRIWTSKKTNNGPLADNWRQQYIQAVKDPNNKDKKLMCAYKLCKVEFRYWGMQNKIERFIHDIGLRKTMLRAHRQAWCWMDEWWGLELSDIRKLERETQEACAAKMSEAHMEDEMQVDDNCLKSKETPTSKTKSDRKSNEIAEKESKSGIMDGGKLAPDRQLSQSGLGKMAAWGTAKVAKRSIANSRSMSEWKVESIETLADTSSDDEEFFDAQETLSDDDDDDDEEEKYEDPEQAILSSSLAIQPDDVPETMEEDVFEDLDESPLSSSTLMKSSSMEALNDEFVDVQECTATDVQANGTRRLNKVGQGGSLNLSVENPPTAACQTTLLFLVLHGGSILETGQYEHGSQQADISTLRATFEKVIRAHYPGIYGHVAIRMVRCPVMSAESLQIITSLSPSCHENVTNDSLPLAAVPLFSTSSPDYQDLVYQVINKANHVYTDFLKSDEGIGFTGQVCLIGDCTGSLIGYDALCHSVSQLSRSSSRRGSKGSINEEPEESKLLNVDASTRRKSASNPDLADETNFERSNTIGGLESKSTGVEKGHMPLMRHLSLPPARRISTSTSTQSEPGHNGHRFDFDVTDFFMFGSPLALVLAYRRMSSWDDKYNNCPPLRPSCHQMYNLFHLSDPSASRLEPLLDERFKFVAPIHVPRYQKFPLGDGQSAHVVETIQNYNNVFSGQSICGQSRSESAPYTSPVERRESTTSILSQMSGHGDPSINTIATAAEVSLPFDPWTTDDKVISRWWGTKRLDYSLYCPDAITNFPTNALPQLFHSSYWESTDVVAFILRQVVRQTSFTVNSEGTKDSSVFIPSQPREKWLHRRTTIKVRNVAPNHRANDIVVLEDVPQVITARFMYGPLDMVSLSREKVDVHIMTQPPCGEWVYFGTETTDSHGRLTFDIPEDKRLSQGMYPVKTVVRGDHTCADFYLAVLPPKTESVVFSIDGSFTASVSIMGKDPKVRAGAVDVVRHWQELGYLIIYVSARPDMQQKRVVGWLAQHNFPHGMVAFMDGLSADPLRQKTQYLKHLVNDARISIHAAYGSSKDISVYQSVGVKSDSIYIVGKVAKKQHAQARIISDGYAAHLSSLAMVGGGMRPAVGNARMFIRKSCFVLPGLVKYSRKQAAKRTSSCPPQHQILSEANNLLIPEIGVSESGNTVVRAGHDTGKAVRSRGISPRKLKYGGESAA